VCAVAFLAACTPTPPTEEFPSCAAILCEYGSDCVEGVGCVPRNDTPPVEEKLTECTDPRPEICTMEYNPVCASVDNGIRCITTPCPSTDWKTYATGCTACADKNVYAYKPGACDPEVDNNPADDEPQAPDDTARLAFTTCTDPRPEMCTKEYNPVCGENKDGERVTQSTGCTACANPSIVGYWPGSCEQPPSDTPSSACADNEDQYMSQIGPACVTRASEADIKAWAQCTDASTCGSDRCAIAARTTNGPEITWSNEAASFRCVPEDYALFLLHTSGLTAIDENGERTTAIA